MKRILIPALLSSLYFISYSQSAFNGVNSYYVDGVHLSQNFYTGTARSMAMGGAFSSLGGDLSSISINPAGVGVYRTSEFAFTPGFYSLSTSSKYQGSTKDNIDYNLNLNNIGVVFTFNSNNNSGWVSTSVALGYNSTNNLNNSYTIGGRTNSTSMVNEFLKNAEGTYFDNLDAYWERMAFDIFLLDTVSGSNGTSYNSPYSGLLIDQKHIYSIKGSTGEYYGAIGANFDHKFYFGGALSIKSSYYEEEFIHQENDVNLISPISYYRFTHTLSTSARGFNIKVGAIFRPVETLRIGLSVNTPTIMQVINEWDSRIVKQDKGGDFISEYPRDVYGDIAPRGQEDYTVTTPFRAIGGVAYVFEQLGLISFDYEFIDYRSLKFSNSSVNEDFSDENQANKNGLRATNNIRLGGEVKLSSYYLRGGYAYYQSPYSSTEINKNSNTLIYSGGLGYRNNNFNIDFGYSLLNRSEKYFMYGDPLLAESQLKANTGSFLVTLGFKF